jgi:hypothetical protein
LFRKPEERPSIVKYDEIEQTAYSTTAAKSSPDDASSDLVQETATSEMSSGKQPEDIKMWSTESDNMTSNAVVPIDSCSNSRATSDVEDQVPEATAVEVRTGFCILASCTPLKINIMRNLIFFPRHIYHWMKIHPYMSPCLVNLIVKFSPQCDHRFQWTWDTTWIHLMPVTLATIKMDFPFWMAPVNRMYPSLNC